MTRRRLLALPLAVALLVVGVKAVTMSVFSSQGADAYDDERYGESVAGFERLLVANVIAPWKAHFGIGDARFRLGDLRGAEEAFREALALAPGRCDVRFNLAVTIEAQGDRLTGGRTRDVTESEREDGLARYRVALDVATGAECPANGPDSAGARLEETRERLANKLGGEGAAGEEVEPPQPVRPDQQQDDVDDDDDKEQQLQDRNQTGAANRQDFSDLDPSLIHPPNQSNW